MNGNGIIGGGEPVRDEKAVNGASAFTIDDVSTFGHHSDSTWATAPSGHLVFVDPQKKSHRRHRRRRHKSKEQKEDPSSEGGAPKTAGPSERIQFLLDDETIDCDVRPIFTEMEELHGSGDSATWREIARWVKFEEDVEEGGNRWSKPHVATLSLHSLFELRSCLMNGTVILDMEAEDIIHIIDIMLDKLIADRHLEFMYREETKQTLLRKKTHQYEQGKKDNQGEKSGSFISTVRSIADIGKTFSSKNLQHGPEGMKSKKYSMPANMHQAKQYPNPTAKPKAQPFAAGAPEVNVTHPESQPAFGTHLGLPKTGSLHKIASQSSTQAAIDTTKRMPSPSHQSHPNLQSISECDSSPSPLPPALKKAKTAGSPEPQPHVALHRSASAQANFIHKITKNTIKKLSVASRPDSHGIHLDGLPSHTCSELLAASLKGNLHFFKKLPPGAEASNVLVGEVDYLHHHVSAFVRLKDPLMLEGLTEVPVPTRFLFVLLGPTGHAQQYREIGRAIATLMSDEIFHDVAYKARQTSDLLDGVDEFLDQVTVLPPGEWDPNIRIEPPSKLPSQEKRMKAVTSEANKLHAVGEADEGGGGDGEGGDGDGAGVVEEVVKEEEGGHGDPTLKRTGRLFGGLILDLKRKLPHYASDFTDALNLQCLASTMFMYFALLAPIVTFGGLLEEATDQRMAAMENLLSGAVCGITYHLFSGQPLTIIGSTGPVLVFETISFDLCKTLGVEYLSFRLWINLWVGAILFFMVATDASALVSFITRFTEESFATLIAVIFIYEAVKKVIVIKRTDIRISEYNQPFSYDTYNCSCVAPQTPDEDFTSWFGKFAKKKRWSDQFLRTNASWAVFNGTAGNGSIVGIDYDKAPLDYCTKLHGSLSGWSCFKMNDVFLMSLVLMVGTYYVAMYLKNFKVSPYFPTFVRQQLANFAVMIAVAVFCLFDYAMGIDTQKLNVPSEFRPTYHGRGWLIDPFLNPWWSYLVAVIPAILATILIFMDQQITAVIVNRKENKLKKGAGYHLDLLVLAIQIVAVGFLGIPIYVAATVMSINHVQSLKVDSESRAPGEVATFVGCKEQRVTGAVCFALIGVSVFMTPILRHIPMAVLYGVFLFMGIGSLGGIQLFDRICLLFMPMKYQPDYMYLRHVPIMQVHAFTLCQVFCLACLWVIKSIKATSITFPLMLVVMVGIRKLMEYVFNPTHLIVLDDKMPEFHLRKKEDAKKLKETKKKKKKGGKAGANDDDGDSGHGGDGSGGLRPVATEAHLHIPMASGNIMKIPLSTMEKDDEKPINMSEELKKSGVWKHIESNASLPKPPADAIKKLPAEKSAPQPKVVFNAGGGRDDDDEDQSPIMIKIQAPTQDGGGGGQGGGGGRGSERQPLLDSSTGHGGQSGASTGSAAGSPV